LNCYLCIKTARQTHEVNKKQQKRYIIEPRGDIIMEILKYLEQIEEKDPRQKSKVKYKISEIVGIVFFAMLANADDYVEIEIFAKHNEKILKEYFELENGIPSHDTISRVMAIIDHKYLQSFREKFYEMLNNEEGDKIKKILAIDGKSQRGNGNKKQKSNHIVSVVDDNGICL